MRPGRAEKTATRSAMAMASKRSWVTKITVFLSRSQIRRNSSSRTSLVWASRAPKGSSIRRMSGFLARVRASETRWRIPWESWLG